MWTISLFKTHPAIVDEKLRRFDQMIMFEQQGCQFGNDGTLFLFVQGALLDPRAARLDQRYFALFLLLSTQMAVHGSSDHRQELDTLRVRHQHGSSSQFFERVWPLWAEQLQGRFC